MAKTLDQKIASAQAELARFKAKSRKQEIGQKVVIGDIVLGAVEHDPVIRSWLLQQVEGDKIKKADVERLAPLIAKWREMDGNGAAEKSETVACFSCRMDHLAFSQPIPFHIFPRGQKLRK